MWHELGCPPRYPQMFEATAPGSDLGASMAPIAPSPLCGLNSLLFTTAYGSSISLLRRASPLTAMRWRINKTNRVHMINSNRRAIWTQKSAARRGCRLGKRWIRSKRQKLGSQSPIYRSSSKQSDAGRNSLM
jgi:hypothetical protein